MITGTWMKRKGETFEVNNVSGGQVIEYDTSPPIQEQMANVPPFYFEAIGLLNSFIEEQGVNTSALGQIPKGVKAGIAIESLKESEYANLKIASNQVKKTIKRVTERMIDIVGKYFITPQEVQILENGDPVDFKIIGDRGKEVMTDAGMNTDDLVTIKRDAKLDIEVESGAAFTYQGKKELVSAFLDKMVLLAREGMIAPEAVKLLVQKVIEIYKIGSISEFTEAMDQAPNDMTEVDLQKIKIAVAEVIKDLGMVGPKASQEHIDETKIGVVEATKDMGLLKPQESGSQEITESRIEETGKDGEKTKTEVKRVQKT